MKAVVYYKNGGPDVFEYTDVDVPAVSLSELQLSAAPTLPRRSLRPDLTKRPPGTHKRTNLERRDTHFQGNQMVDL